MSIPDTPKKINIIAFIAIVVVLGFFLAFGGLKLSHFFSQKPPIRVVSAQITSKAGNREEGSKSDVLRGVSGVDSSSLAKKTYEKAR